MGFDIDDESLVENRDTLDEDGVYDVSIKVVGVGGGGCNAVEHMAKKYAELEEANKSDDDDEFDFEEDDALENIEFIAVNTDVAALKQKDKNLMRRIQIGRKVCKGRGAGGRPETAAEAATENREEIEKALKNASIVFVSGGMGGGTGTGAAPVIAQIAQEMNIVTVGVVTKPFEFEREHKMNQAMKGIEEMRKHVDALLIIPNERLLKREKALSFKEAFAMVDDVLYRSVKIVSDIVTNKDSKINTDFADLCTILKDAGDAHIALGVGTGENKIEEAVSQVINSPLLETSIQNATKLLVNVTLAGDASIQDLGEISSRITNAAAPGAVIIQGVAQDEALENTISIAVIAAGFKQGATAAASVPAEQATRPTASEPLVSFGDPLAQNDNDSIVTSKNDGNLASLITNTLGGTQFRDGYDELEDIFNARRRNNENK